MNAAMRAIIKKDIRSVTVNRRMFASLLIVPIVMAVGMPTILLLANHFAPDDPDTRKLLELLSAAMSGESQELMVAKMVLDYLMPTLFLIIPILTATVMAASAFVGEKERRTLETLLYCPLSVKQIFRAKVFAAFLLSMAVSALSFVTMLVVIEAETFVLAGTMIVPSASWLVILCILAPSIALIAVTMIVRGSAKAQSVEESQQSAAYLVMLPILLMIGQVTGLMLVGLWLFLAIGVVCALAAWFLLKNCMGRADYEMLLK